MKIKSSELIGPPLEWAVAKCEGHHDYRFDGKHGRISTGRHFDPTTDWSQGGPIIEREHIRWNEVGGQFYAWTPDHEWYDPLHEPMLDDLGVSWRAVQYGPTLLVAAMRCYVTAKLGDEVNIPEELLQ